MKRFKEWLSHPWLPVIATLLAVGLMIPSLWNGLILDDYFHRLVLLKDAHSISCASSPLNLFCFSNGNPEANRQMMNSGFLPWYTQENFQKAIKHFDKAVSLGFDAHPDFLKKLEAYRNA